MFLKNIYTYLTADTPGYVRKMGYLYQSIALENRYLRRKSSWQGHLDNSRKFIIDTAHRCAARGNVIVLGSGILLDVPLDQLSELFDRVLLVDVVHLPHVLKKIKKYKNVIALQADVTDVAERMFENIRKKNYVLPQGSPFIPGLDADTGLIVSLNIFSQLYAFPVDYIQKNAAAFDSGNKRKWCASILAAHYDMINSQNADVCFIADYYYTRRYRSGEVAEEGSTIGNIQLPEPERSWVWNIAPAEKNGLTAKELNVGAWHITPGNKK